MKVKKFNKKVDHGISEKYPYIFCKGKNEYNFVQGRIIEPGLIGTIRSQIGPQSLSSTWRNIKMYIAQVEYDKLQYEKIWDSAKRKYVMRKFRATYGSNKFFVNWYKAFNYIVKQMKLKRKEVRIAYFFHANKYPDSINNSFIKELEFKGSKIILIKR